MSTEEKIMSSYNCLLKLIHQIIWAFKKDQGNIYRR